MSDIDQVIQDFLHMKMVIEKLIIFLDLFKYFVCFHPVTFNLLIYNSHIKLQM